MSLRKHYTLVCDNCKIHTGVYSSTVELRKVARRCGWVRIGSRDICSTCVKRVRAGVAQRDDE